MPGVEASKNPAKMFGPVSPRFLFVEFWWFQFFEWQEPFFPAFHCLCRCLVQLLLYFFTLCFYCAGHRLQVRPLTIELCFGVCHHCSHFCAALCRGLVEDHPDLFCPLSQCCFQLSDPRSCVLKLPVGVGCESRLGLLQLGYLSFQCAYPLGGW